MTNKEAIEILKKWYLNATDGMTKERLGYIEGWFTEKDKKAFELAIKALEESEWIPVSERLPERYKEVIVTDIETSGTYQSRYIGNGYWDCDNGTFKNRIIAWMPLPEAYKDADDEC